MRIDQLRYFIVSSESQTISEAAKKLNLTQPSLSSSLASMEEELGINLFERSHRGIHITRTGKEALHYAKKILKNYEDMIRAFKEKDHELRNINISMINGLTYSMWTYDIIKYCDIHNINICIHTSTFSPPFGEEYYRDFLFHLRLYSEEMVKFIKSQIHKYNFKFEIVSCGEGNILINKKNKLSNKKFITMKDLEDMNISIAFLTKNDKFYIFKNFIDLIQKDKKHYVSNRNAMIESVINNINNFCILNDYYDLDKNLINNVVCKKIKNSPLKCYLCMFTKKEKNSVEDENLLNLIRSNYFAKNHV